MAARSPGKPKILFLCHALAPVGGASVVAAWMLEALAPLYDVTIYTWGQPDLAGLDRSFGTSLACRSFRVRTPAPAMAWLVDRIPDNSSHQRANYLLRLAKRARHEYDAVVSGAFEADLVEPVVQYIHYPYLAVRTGDWTVPGDAPLAERIPGLLRGKTRPWMLVSGYSFARLRSNLTLANSQWTCDELDRRCGIPSEVLYPPAPGDFPSVPWDQRRDAFVAIGRLHPDKRFERIVEILAMVRRDVPQMELRLCGFPGRPDYMWKLKALAAGHGPWIRIHEDLTRADLIGLMSECRYGVHALIDEHFGIAPAEMARAGCIPFVHNSGGQVEIIGRDDRLCYTTPEEAAAKIVRVMRNQDWQHELRDAVRSRSESYTPQAFVAGFRRHMERFLARTRDAQGMGVQSAC